MNHKNKYAKEAQRKELLGFNTATIKEKAKKIDGVKIATNTGRDIVIGGIGGGLAGTLIGRYSFIAGILVTGIGHALNSPTTSGFGIGLMASGGFQGVKGMNGATDGIDGVKDRLAHYKETIKKQFFIDKIQNAKAKKQNADKDESTNGVGTVQYFKHPNQEEADLNGKTELDFAEANKLEQQMESIAKAFAQKQSMSGNYSATPSEDINGLEGDLAERLI